MCSRDCARPKRGPQPAIRPRPRRSSSSSLPTTTPEPGYRSLGELLSAQRAITNADPAALLADLESLIGTNDPWRHSALELRALAQMRSGDTAAARQTLDDLLDDPLTPPDLVRRAAELLAFLGGPPAADAAEEARPEEPAPEEPRADQAEEGAVAEGD